MIEKSEDRAVEQNENETNLRKQIFNLKLYERKIEQSWNFRTYFFWLNTVGEIKWRKKSVYMNKTCFSPFGRANTPYGYSLTLICIIDLFPIILVKKWQYLWHWRNNDRQRNSFIWKRIFDYETQNCWQCIYDANKYICMTITSGSWNWKPFNNLQTRCLLRQNEIASFIFVIPE